MLGHRLSALYSSFMLAPVMHTVILLGKDRVAIHSFLVELRRPTKGRLLLGERPKFGCHVLIQDALI